MNDQFVSHPGPALGLNFYITNVLAVGVGGGYYFNSDSKFNAETRRAARVAVPLTEYQWQAALNFTYVPMYGKFAGFSDFIFHYDAYVVGGVGAISTRPIAVVDPDNRLVQVGRSQGRLQRRHRPSHLLQSMVCLQPRSSRLHLLRQAREHHVRAIPAQAANEKTWYGPKRSSPTTFRPSSAFPSSSHSRGTTGCRSDGHQASATHERGEDAANPPGARGATWRSCNQPPSGSARNPTDWSLGRRARSAPASS